MAKTFFKWATFPLLVILCLPIGIYWYFDHQFDESVAEYRQKQLAVLPLVKQDLEFVRRNNPFPQVMAHRQKSAGPFLNHRFPWTLDATPGDLAIDENTLDALNTDDYLELPPSTWQGRDFGWLREAMAYDHWSIWDSGPILDQRDDPHRLPIHIPSISYTDLMAWAKLRLLHASHHDDDAQAIQEVRHLARLVLTHETIVGTLMGLRIWGLTDLYCREKEIPNEEALRPELIEVTRRLIFYQLGAMNFMADPQVRKMFLRPDRHRLGWCAASLESLIYSGFLQMSDFAEVADLEKSRELLLDHSGCLFAPEVKKMPPPSLEDLAGPQEKAMMEVPFFRGIVFRILLMVGKPSPDSGYEVPSPSEGGAG